MMEWSESVTFLWLTKVEVIDDVSPTRILGRAGLGASACAYSRPDRRGHRYGPDASHGKKGCSQGHRRAPTSSPPSASPNASAPTPRSSPFSVTPGWPTVHRPVPQDLTLAALRRSRQPTDIPYASLATWCTSPVPPSFFRIPPISVSSTLSINDRGPVSRGKLRSHPADLVLVRRLPLNHGDPRSAPS